jgi:hypothetical protein
VDSLGAPVSAPAQFARNDAPIRARRISPKKFFCCSSFAPLRGLRGTKNFATVSRRAKAAKGAKDFEGRIHFLRFA